MSVHDAVYPHSLGPGTPAPSRTSDYTGQYDSGPSLTYPPVPSLRSSVGQDPRSYYTQDPPRTAVRHPDNTAGYPDQYPVGNAKYYHSIPPGLGRHVSESPMYHADSYDCYSTGPIPYGQPPAVIAPYGVTGQTPGNYARQGAGLYEGQQSDDDYQRHNADRNRREGRTQDRFGQRNQRASRQNEYFLNGEGIHLDVLQRNICRYLGSEASARPSVFNVCTADICSLVSLVDCFRVCAGLK